MPSLKAIRSRILSTKSTQKITRAMKMISAARLRRAQQRITELRPFAVKTAQVLRDVVMRNAEGETTTHPLLAHREERSVLLVVTVSDRGLAGGFNAQVNRAAERLARDLESQGKKVSMLTIGRKGRDYFRRRGFDIVEEIPGVTERLGITEANNIAAKIIDLFTGGTTSEGEAVAGEAYEEHAGGAVVGLLPEANPVAEDRFDAVYFLYNEFRSAMSQQVNIDRLLPIEAASLEEGENVQEFLYEPSREGLLDRLLPLYVQTTVYRGLLESIASEHGARMTAMDAATNNAKEMIGSLTLEYNRARQAAITKELMEIIGGSEALK